MMRRLIYCLVASGFLFAFNACEDAFVNEVDIDLPDNERQLVIEATLVPGDTSFAYITRTEDLNQRFEFEGVGGADLVVFSNGEEIARFEERSVEVSQRFRSNRNEDFPEYYTVIAAEDFYAAETLTMTVDAPNGDRTTATQPVPGSTTLSNLEVRDLDFDLRTSFRVGGSGTAHLVTAQLRNFRPFYNNQGEIVRYDTVLNPLNFSTGEDIDYVYYGERYLARSPMGSSVAPVLNASGGFGGCLEADCGDGLEPSVLLRARAINPLAADYFEALQQLDQTDDNPFVEPVALPTAWEGARGMLTLLSEGGVLEAEVE